MVNVLWIWGLGVCEIHVIAFSYRFGVAGLLTSLVLKKTRPGQARARSFGEELVGTLASSLRGKKKIEVRKEECWGMGRREKIMYEGENNSLQRNHPEDY